MQRIVLACAALAFGILGSPLAAQQTTPEQQPAPTQPAPTPDQQTTPEAPPPFPPMPKARPSHRFVNVGGELRATREHHRTVRSHHERAKARRQRAHAHHERVAPPSRKTVRKCHAMSYKQIMRSDTCRALMKQELGAGERHAKHKHDAGRHHHHRAKHRRD